MAASLAFGFVAWRLVATRTAAMAWLLYKLSGPYLAVVMLAMLADRLVQPLSISADAALTAPLAALSPGCGHLLPAPRRRCAARRAVVAAGQAPRGLRPARVIT